MVFLPIGFRTTLDRFPNLRPESSLAQPVSERPEGPPLHLGFRFHAQPPIVLQPRRGVRRRLSLNGCGSHNNSVGGGCGAPAAQASLFPIVAPSPCLASTSGDPPGRPPRAPAPVRSRAPRRIPPPSSPQPCLSVPGAPCFFPPQPVQLTEPFVVPHLRGSISNSGLDPYSHTISQDIHLTHVGIGRVAQSF